MFKMDTAPIPHKGKIELLIKPPDPIDQAKNDLNRKRGQQPDKHKKEKDPFYDINHPPEGYA